VSEAPAVKPADLDLEEARVTIQAGKGNPRQKAGKRRTATILRDVLPVLVEWNAERKAAGLNGRHA
jgi:integrase